MDEVGVRLNLITPDEPAVVAKPFLDPIVIEECKTY